MSLSGSLEIMPFPDLVQFIGLGRKTGAIHVDGSNGKRIAYFEDGFALGCTSGDPLEDFAPHLLQRTSLTRQDLAEITRLRQSGGEPLRDLLCRIGQMTPAGLDSVLQRKAEDALHELVSWTEGAFQFVPGEVPRDSLPVTVMLDWQGMIMEGARQADDMGRLRRRLGGPEARFRVVDDAKANDAAADPGGKKLLEMVRDGLTLREICLGFHSSDLDILGRLDALIDQGVVATGRETPQETASPTTVPNYGAKAVIQQAEGLVKQALLAEALELLRDSSKRFFDDANIAGMLWALERALRHSFESLPDGLDAVPRLRGRPENLMTASLGAERAFLLSRICGTWSLRSLLRVCPFDELTVFSHLHGLARDGLIELPGLDPTRTRPAAQGTADPATQSAPATPPQAEAEPEAAMEEGPLSSPGVTSHNNPGPSLSAIALAARKANPNPSGPAPEPLPFDPNRKAAGSGK